MGLNDRFTIHPLLSRRGKSLWLGYLDTSTVMMHGDSPMKGSSVQRLPVVSATSESACKTQLKLEADKLRDIQTARGFTVQVQKPRRLMVPRA